MSELVFQFDSESQDPNSPKSPRVERDCNPSSARMCLKGGGASFFGQSKETSPQAGNQSNQKEARRQPEVLAAIFLQFFFGGGRVVALLLHRFLLAMGLNSATLVI